MTPLSHTAVLSGLAAGTLLAHTHERAVLQKPLAIATTAPVVTKDGPTVPSGKAAVTPAKSDNLVDCVLVAASATLTDPQGKTLVKEQPSILLIAGNQGSMVSTSQERSSILNVQTTVMNDKNIMIDAKLTENVSIDGKTVTYHPHILSKVGQATEATVEDTHGTLRFQIDSKLTRQPVNAHPAPKTPAVSAGTGTNSPARP